MVEEEADSEQNAQDGQHSIPLTRSGLGTVRAVSVLFHRLADCPTQHHTAMQEGRGGGEEGREGGEEGRRGGEEERRGGEGGGEGRRGRGGGEERDQYRRAMQVLFGSHPPQVEGL